MTDKQLNEERSVLYRKMRDGGFDALSEEQKIRYEELSCIDMINSILAYHWSGESAENVVSTQEQSYHNYLAGYIKKLGREKVVEFVKEQIQSIRRIRRDVYQDSDGLLYNSVDWN